MKKRQLIKDLARALSLANLCFIVTWTELLSPARDYWLQMPLRYSFNGFVSVVLNVLILATLIFAAISLARRSTNSLGLKVARVVFPVMLFIPLNGFIRMLLPQRADIIQLILLLPVIGVLALSDIAPWNRIILRGASTIVLILFPFVVMTFAQAFWSMTKFSNKTLETPVSAGNTSAPRVLWLVFDEMDERMTAPNRPPAVKLPELDRLRGESLYASGAYPPADVTEWSMPALMTGRLISDVRPLHPSEMMITFEGSEKPVKLSTQPNVFSEARTAGFNAAVIGTYFPYCRIIGNSLRACYHHELARVSLRENMLNDAVSFIKTIPLAPNVGSFFGVFKDIKVWEREERQRLKDAYLGILEDAKRLAVDNTLGLILVHFPIPHPPNIYNRHEDKFELSAESSYLDNLELCDRALGEIRAELEIAGLWDETIILVTSDHWWRTEVWRSGLFWSNEDEETMPPEIDHRVPFLLKLAGQKHSVEYNSQFNTVLTHDLLLALLQGKLTGADDVAHWLDQHRSIAESPYHFR